MADTEKTIEKVYLGLGTNLGDRENYIAAAFGELSKLLEGCVLSSIYETKPQDVTDQPDFLNAVCSGYCSLDPYELLDRINRIEKSLGRDRSAAVRRGPRTVDIDILLYGNRKVEDPPVLVIPHERMNQRRFVLQPLVELDPELREPGTGRYFSSILETLPAQGIYCFQPKRYI